MDSGTVVRTDPVDRVKNMVRHALVASPNVTNQELYDRALEIAPAAVQGLSLRQFHARFRLPVIRHEMGPRLKARRDAARAERAQANGATKASTRSRTGTAKQKRAKRTRGSSDFEQNGALPRAEIRQVIADFAVDLEKAEQRSELVRVMAQLEDVVERILEITTSHNAPPRPRKMQSTESEAAGSPSEASTEAETSAQPTES